jgi:hypothetical protein
METDKKCFFCDSQCGLTPLNVHLEEYSCQYCGQYLLNDLLMGIYPSNKNDKFKIACVLNERRLKGLGGVALSNKTDKEKEAAGYPIISFDELLNEFPKKASDFFNRTLLNLSNLPIHPFELIKFDLENKGNHLTLFSTNSEECIAFLNELELQGFTRRLPGLIDFSRFSLSTKLWEFVENLQREEIDNKRAFVAMWFDESMDDYYKDGIKKALEEAGYDPIKINLQDFNGKICDEIIADIKRSKFLIADCSKYRTAVFFEAGFAKGLGREVIFTVRKNDIEELKEHFDTRQYNHIVYDSTEDLRKKLYNRICATIV